MSPSPTITIQATSNGFMLLPAIRGDYIGLDQAEVFNRVEDLCAAVGRWASERERGRTTANVVASDPMVAAMSGNGNFSTRN